jgi:NitT/TauT family transport system permease protein
MSALVAFFPIVINTINGLNSVDSMKLDLFKSLGATKWQTFRMLKAPNAMPYIFAGLDIGAVFAVTGAIIGEFVGSQGGLGNLALRMQFEFNIPGYFAVLCIIMPLGLILHFIVTTVQKRVVFWVHTTNR